MSTMGSVRPFTVTLTCGTTFTSAFDLGGSYRNVMAGIPTAPSGSFYFLASDTSDGTFRRLYHEPTVATAVPKVVVCDSSTTNCFFRIPMYARYGKIEITSLASSTLTFKMLCSP